MPDFISEWLRCFALHAGVLIGLPALLCLFFSIQADLLRFGLIRTAGARGFLYFTAPGVVLHECAHALLCLIFCHRIEKISFFRSDPGRPPGFVEHSWNNRNLYADAGSFFIAIAPVLAGGAALLALSALLLPVSAAAPLRLTPEEIPAATAAEVMRILGETVKFSTLTGWRFWVWLYAVIVFCPHLGMSREDSGAALYGAGFMLLILAAAAAVSVWLGADAFIVPRFILPAYGALAAILFVTVPLTLLICLASLHWLPHGDDCRRPVAKKR